MNGVKDFFNQIDLLIQQISSGNKLWQFVAFLSILVIGLVVLEIVFRSAGRRLQVALEKKGFSPDAWKLSVLLPPLRLASTALLLGLTETLLLLPEQLAKFSHAVEGLLLTLAGIVVSFHIVNLLDRLTGLLPSHLQTHLQNGFPEPILSKLKSVLRIAVLIAGATAFVGAQKDLFPEWIWRQGLWRYLLTVVILYVIFLLIRLIEKFLSGLMLDLKSQEEKTRLRLVLSSTIWPIRLLLITMAVYAIKEILPLPDAANRLAEGLIGLMATLAVVVFVYQLVDVVAHELSRIAQKEDNLMDQAFVHMIRIIARVLVVIVGAIYIIQAISGKPMSALLAGLGIGGLAVALAAQDTLKNFFGSIMIMLDKPFNVGQRILVEGFDGVVEDIGFRSTRVRTLTGNLVTVPNEKMAGANIENVGCRPSIRRLTNITITYDTLPEKVERALSILKQILDNHEGMHPDFPPRVFFNEFNDASLNIVMIYWYHPPDYWGYSAFSERVNLQIMRAFEAEGIEFAFPTTTTYLAQDNKRPLHISVSDESHRSIQDLPGKGQ